MLTSARHILKRYYFMDNIHDIKLFLEPQSIAIIGISRKTGEKHDNALQNLLAYGYRGRIYPVNPNADEILGIKAYPSIKSIENPVDHAVIVTPRTQVPGHIRDCAEKGVKAITIVTQGFSDAGDDEGQYLHKEIVRLASTTGVRILGPNSFGSANVYTNFCPAFAKLQMQRNPVALVCQSGMLFNGVSEYRFVGKGIDVANITNVDFADCLEYFEQDPQVKVIVLHIEGMPDARRFLKIARRVSMKKPVIALKTGRGEQGIAAAQSHTGSLAGKNEVWDSAFKQAGVISVDNLEELVDVTRTLSMLPVMDNPNVAVATFSGGTGIMALDGMRNSKLRSGDLPPKTRDLLKKHTPAWLSVGNPLDYWPMIMGADNQPGMIIEILEPLLQDNSFGGIIFIQIVPDEYRGEYAKQILTGMVEKYPHRPLTAIFTGPLNSEYVKKLQEEGKVLAFPTPERASRALARLWQYSEYRRQNAVY